MDGKKIKGGAEKVREKKKQKLLSEASTCYSLETLFTKMTVRTLFLVNYMYIIYYV